MIDRRTLVIAVVSPLDDAYQCVLLRELANMGAQIMTISSREENIYGAALNVTLPEYANYAVRGIPLLFCLQAIGYYKALADGKDPDVGENVSNWVKI
jgi:fructoselysine-6-P-deglycase FrlB-like protein